MLLVYTYSCSFLSCLTASYTLYCRSKSSMCRPYASNQRCRCTGSLLVQQRAPKRIAVGAISIDVEEDMAPDQLHQWPVANTTAFCQSASSASTITGSASIVPTLSSATTTAVAIEEDDARAQEDCWMNAVIIEHDIDTLMSLFLNEEPDPMQNIMTSSGLLELCP